MSCGDHCYLIHAKSFFCSFHKVTASGFWWVYPSFSSWLGHWVSGQSQSTKDCNKSANWKYRNCALVQSQIPVASVLHCIGPVYPRYYTHSKQWVLFPYSKFLACVRHMESGNLHIPEDVDHRREFRYSSPGQYISNVAFHVSAMI